MLSIANLKFSSSSNINNYNAQLITLLISNIYYIIKIILQ